MSDELPTNDPVVEAVAPDRPLQANDPLNQGDEPAEDRPDVEPDPPMPSQPIPPDK